MEQPVAEWPELTRLCTWDDLLREYYDCLRRVETHCQAHPSARSVAGPLSLALGGLATLFVGLKSVIEDPSRHEELAPRELAEIVLGLARRVRRDVPQPEPIQPESITGQA
jgi:hypothetical protein